jgi:cell division transport system permease protein
MSRNPLRPARFDDLGLRRALSDRLVPLLVAAMAFLAALALAGAVGASSLASRWQSSAASELTVQVPHADATGAGGQLDRVLAILRGTQGVVSARPLDPQELDDLLRPWLGSGTQKLSLPLPAVVQVRLGVPTPDLEALAGRLQETVPGTLVESQGVWMQRLSALARSVQACAAAALLVVALVAAAVIAVATRAGLAARRDAIEIVHGLGATDGYIAWRFARRTTLLATGGGVLGALAALPVLLILAGLAAPFAPGRDDAAMQNPLQALPAVLWLTLPGLPITAAVIGWATAQGTVRRWLRRLP